DRGSHPECETVSGCAGRVRHVRSVHLGFRRARAEAELLAVNPESAGQVGRIGCHEQGPEAAWVHIRRQHDLLCLHASCGYGKRSPGRVFPARGARETGRQSTLNPGLRPGLTESAFQAGRTALLKRVGTSIATWWLTSWLPRVSVTPQAHPVASRRL